MHKPSHVGLFDSSGGGVPDPAIEKPKRKRKKRSDAGRQRKLPTGGAEKQVAGGPAGRVVGTSPERSSKSKPKPKPKPDRPATSNPLAARGIGGGRLIEELHSLVLKRKV